MKSGIYCIQHKRNKKIYIGSSANISGRFYQHKKELNQGTHHSSHLQNAWVKDGPDSFVFEIIEKIPREELILREQFWIDHYKSYERARGYNTSPSAGNCRGLKVPRDVLKKRRLARRVKEGKPIMPRTRSEHSEKMSARGKKGAETRWAKHHEEIGPRNYPPDLPSDCFRITVDNLVTGKSHVLVFHPGSRRGRYMIDVDGKPWQECGFSAALAKIRKSCKLMPLYLFD